MSAEFGLLQRLQNWTRNTLKQRANNRARRQSERVLLRLDPRTLRDVTGLSHRELRHQFARQRKTRD